MLSQEDEDQSAQRRLNLKKVNNIKVFGSLCFKHMPGERISNTDEKKRKYMYEPISWTIMWINWCILSET